MTKKAVPDEQKRKNKITIWLTDEEKEEIKSLSKQENLTMSSYCMKKLLNKEKVNLIVPATYKHKVKVKDGEKEYTSKVNRVKSEWKKIESVMVKKGEDKTEYKQIKF